MADTSMVDLPDLIEQRTGIRLGKAYGTGAKRTRKGPCPFCKQGTDRFAVFVNDVPQHYYCGVHGHGCGSHGDAITLLREYAGMSYFEACEELDIDPGSTYVRSVATACEVKNAPCHTWQLQAELIINRAQVILQSEKGAHALKYLRERGFTDEMIAQYRIGYIPDWYLQPFEVWGLKQENYPDEDKASGYKEGVHLYEGILIPCYEGETIWKLTVRRLTGLKEDDPKYLDILGSGEGLFNVDAIKTDHPVVICEGPLDALSGIRTCGDLAAFVATGSTTRGRTLRWEMRLNVASRVLVAYDDDVEKGGKRAGDEGAKYWLRTLSHASQWLPWAHDINEMLTSGVDLSAWLAMGLASSALQRETDPDPVIVASPVEAPPICSRCQRQDTDPDITFHLIDEGVYCCQFCLDVPVASTTDKERFQRKIESLLKRMPDQWQDMQVSEIIRNDDVPAYKQSVLDAYRRRYDYKAHLQVQLTRKDPQPS